MQDLLSRYLMRKSNRETSLHRASRSLSHENSLKCVIQTAILVVCISLPVARTAWMIISVGLMNDCEQAMMVSTDCVKRQDSCYSEACVRHT